MAPIPVYTVGIAGGSGAGKSTLARKIFDSLGGATNCTYLFHDSYYKDMSSKSLEERSRINFDHPDSLETELLIHHIRELKKGNIVEVPVYDFTTHTRVCRKKSIELHGPRPILIVEGILILCIPELVKEMDLKVYVDAAPDIRFIRRMHRDCTERGRTADQVVSQYQQTVRPMHQQYVEPSKEVADIIVHSAEATDPGAPHYLDTACEVLKNHLRVIAGLVNQKPVASMEEALEHMLKRAHVSQSESEKS